MLDGEIAERSKAADCKSAGETFGGSNPPLPIVSCFFAGVTQLEEYRPSKPIVAGSNPVSRLLVTVHFCNSASDNVSINYRFVLTMPM